MSRRKNATITQWTRIMRIYCPAKFCFPLGLFTEFPRARIITSPQSRWLLGIICIYIYIYIYIYISLIDIVVVTTKRLPMIRREDRSRVLSKSSLPRQDSSFWPIISTLAPKEQQCLGERLISDGLDRSALDRHEYRLSPALKISIHQLATKQASKRRLKLRRRRKDRPRVTVASRRHIGRILYP